MIGIYQEINFNDFVDGFLKAGRGDQFSYEGLYEIYQYLMDLSQDTGLPVKFNPIAICCDWTECPEEEAKDYLWSTKDEVTVKRLHNGNIIFQNS